MLRQWSVSDVPLAELQQLWDHDHLGGHAHALLPGMYTEPLHSFEPIHSCEAGAPFMSLLLLKHLYEE